MQEEDYLRRQKVLSPPNLVGTLISRTLFREVSDQELMLRGWNGSTAGRENALHEVNWGSISSIPNGTPSLLLIQVVPNPRHKVNFPLFLEMSTI